MAKDFLGRIIRDDLPNPADMPELFDSVLTRRVIAFFIDCLLIWLLFAAVTLATVILGVLTFGLMWLAIPVLLAIAFIGYYALTLGSARRATPGMQAMDLVMTPTRAMRFDGWLAVLHIVLFWVSVAILTPFIVAVALFTPRRQMLHDIVAGTLVVRRSPMVRHWRRMAGAPA